MDNQYKNINFKELCNELGPEFIQKMNEVQIKEDEQDFNGIRDGLKKRNMLYLWKTIGSCGRE